MAHQKLSNNYVDFLTDINFRIETAQKLWDSKQCELDEYVETMTRLRREKADKEAEFIAGVRNLRRRIRVKSLTAVSHGRNFKIWCVENSDMEMLASQNDKIYIYFGHYMLHSFKNFSDDVEDLDDYYHYCYQPYYVNPPKLAESDAVEALKRCGISHNVVSETEIEI